jgi:hypothetical protein
LRRTSQPRLLGKQRLIRSSPLPPPPPVMADRRNRRNRTLFWGFHRDQAF